MAVCFIMNNAGNLQDKTLSVLNNNTSIWNKKLHHGMQPE